MPNTSFNYEVPDMELVVQDKDMACWFASAMMLVTWREKRSTFGQCAALDDATIKLYQANKGIQNHQIIPLAKRLGLVSVPPLSPSVDALRGWIEDYGPLWTNGMRHIVVIAGIRGPVGPSFSYEVKVYDPWPGNGVTWRTLDGWYTGWDPGKFGASSRDAGGDVETVFLHLPDPRASY